MASWNDWQTFGFESVRFVEDLGSRYFCGEGVPEVQELRWSACFESEICEITPSTHILFGFFGNLGNYEQ